MAYDILKNNIKFKGSYYIILYHSFDELDIIFNFDKPL